MLPWALIKGNYPNSLDPERNSNLKMGQNYSNLERNYDQKENTNIKGTTEVEGKENINQLYGSVDPRSPTQSVQRTPIRYTPKKGSTPKSNCYKKLVNEFDPRSPSDVIDRTPLRGTNTQKDAVVGHKLFCSDDGSND